MENGSKEEVSLGKSGGRAKSVDDDKIKSVEEKNVVFSPPSQDDDDNDNEPKWGESEVEEEKLNEKTLVQACD